MVGPVAARSAPSRPSPSKSQARMPRSVGSSVVSRKTSRSIGRVLKARRMRPVANAATIMPRLMSVTPIARSVSFVRRKLGMNVIDGEIVLPVNGYNLAGISSQYTSDRIGRELKLRLEDESSAEDFGAATMVGRSNVLAELGEIMADPLLRMQYDEEIYYGQGEWYITKEEISGALALLLVRQNPPSRHHRHMKNQMAAELPGRERAHDVT